MESSSIVSNFNNHKMSIHGNKLEKKCESLMGVEDPSRDSNKKTRTKMRKEQKNITHGSNNKRIKEKIKTAPKRVMPDRKAKNIETVKANQPVSNKKEHGRKNSSVTLDNSIKPESLELSSNSVILRTREAATHQSTTQTSSSMLQKEKVTNGKKNTSDASPNDHNYHINNAISLHADSDVEAAKIVNEKKFTPRFASRMTHSNVVGAMARRTVCWPPSIFANPDTTDFSDFRKCNPELKALIIKKVLAARRLFGKSKAAICGKIVKVNPKTLSERGGVKNTISNQNREDDMTLLSKTDVTHAVDESTICVTDSDDETGSTGSEMTLEKDLMEGNAVQVEESETVTERDLVEGNEVKRKTSLERDLVGENKVKVTGKETALRRDLLRENEVKVTGRETSFGRNSVEENKKVSVTANDVAEDRDFIRRNKVKVTRRIAVQLRDFVKENEANVTGSEVTSQSLVQSTKLVAKRKRKADVSSTTSKRAKKTLDGEHEQCSTLQQSPVHSENSEMFSSMDHVEQNVYHLLNPSENDLSNAFMYKGSKRKACHNDNNKITGHREGHIPNTMAHDVSELKNSSIISKSSPNSDTYPLDKIVTTVPATMPESFLTLSDSDSQNEDKYNNSSPSDLIDRQLTLIRKGEDTNGPQSKDQAMTLNEEEQNYIESDEDYGTKRDGNHSKRNEDSSVRSYQAFDKKEACLILGKNKSSNARGLGGWENSLRQQPNKTQPFQVENANFKKRKEKSDFKDKMKTDSSSQGSSSSTSLDLVEENSSPSRGLGGWENSLRKKPNKTQQFQIEYSKVKKRKEKSDFKDKTKTDSSSQGSSSSTSLELVEENTADVGRLVWAKLGRNRPWPGMIIAGFMAKVKLSEFGSTWIFWFGDHKISQVSFEKIIPFVYNFNMCMSKKPGKLFFAGVLEAVKICAERCQLSSEEYLSTDEQLMKWAADGFSLPEKDWIDLRHSPFDPKPGEDIPEYVRENLRRISESLQEERNANIVTKSRTRDERESAIELVRSGQKQMKDICIACDDIGKEVKDEHPLFDGGLCHECKDELTENLFVYGQDGTNVYCVVCGGGGELFVCDIVKCGKAYCTECLEVFLGESQVVKIRKAEPWFCLLCSPYDEKSHGYLRPVSNHQQSIVRFYDTGYRVQKPDLSYLSGEDKKPIQVLSLFDGIGTAKLVLDNLGLKIDKFYSSEIDPEAILVTTVHHGNSIQQIGDVQKLSEEKIQKLGPIDLVIGGSPCNDLSLANPGRRGFEFGGTGILFFHFHRVLRAVQKVNGDRHVFWMYENVASMKTEYKDVISSFLECAPALWNAGYLSAQKRPRYFWGNIPAMYSTPEMSGEDLGKSTKLGTMLVQNCNRKAVVDKLRTVTTRSNSLKFGKNDAFFPVTMNGKEDNIWVSELERVFGFPAHYTDVGNLSQTSRKKLLGRSWSVPVVQQILSPLTEYFATKGDHSEDQA